MFRGREMQHISRGSEILNAVAKELEDVAKIERYANRDGRRMHMSLMPKPGLKPPPKKAEKKEKPEKEAEAEKKPEKEDEGEKAKEPVKVDGNPAASEADPDEAAPEAAGPAE
jgi:hypothetical protein